MSKISDLKPDYKAAAEFLGGLPLEAINVTALAPDSDKPIVSHSFTRNPAGIAGCEKFLEKYGAEGRNLYFNCNDLSVRLSKSKRKLEDGTEKLVYKAEEAEVRRVNMLFTDVDPPKGTAQADLPAARAKLLARAKAHQPAPIIIINSGNGFGLFWCLDKPIKVTPANLLELKGYNKKLVDDLEGDPACINLDHVMRIPYTINMPGKTKREAGRVPVMATLIVDDSCLETCTIDRFTSAAVEPGAAVTSGNEYAGIGSPEIPEKVDLSTLPPKLQALIQDGAPAGANRSSVTYGVACGMRRAGWSDGAIIHVLTNLDYKISAHILDQPQREHDDQAARIILRMNTDGVQPDPAPTAAEPADDDAAEPMSDEDKKARALETIVKLFQVNAGNATAGEVENARAGVFSLAQRYKLSDIEIRAAIDADDIKRGQAPGADPWAAAKPAGTSMAAEATWAADIHKPQGQQPRETWFSIKRNFVYIGRHGLFVRKSDGVDWKVQEFERQFGYVRFDIPNPPNSLTKFIFDLRPGYGMDTFDSFCFVPSAPGTPTNVNIGGNYNQFVPSTILPAEGDTAIWDAHLVYLFPDELTRNDVLNWMAWVYKYPHMHTGHALAVIGEIQGTGKSFMQRVLSRLLSSTATNPVSQKTLEAAHEAWPLRTKLALVEVRSATEKLADVLHEMIDGEKIHVDSKNVHDVEIPNVLAFWLETNRAAAIRGLDNSDRRYLVVSVDPKNGEPLKPLDKAYGRALDGKDGVGGLIRDDVALAAIAYTLQNRELGEYSGAERAPDTEAKRTLIANTRPALQQWMIANAGDLRGDTREPLDRRLITVEDVKHAAPDDLTSNYRNPDGKPGDIRQDIARFLKAAPFYGENLGQVRVDNERPVLWYLHRLRVTTFIRSHKPPFADINRKLAQAYKAEKWLTGQTDEVWQAKRDIVSDKEAARRLREAQEEFQAAPQ